MPNDNAFLGRGWSFPPTFDAGHKNIAMVDADQDIKESLGILLSTHPGERVMAPEYGCAIKSMVFDQIDLTTLTEIKSLIEHAVLFYEPRITLEQININTDHASEGRLLIALDYTVITTNSRSNMVYPFYLMEGTLVDV